MRFISNQAGSGNDVTFIERLPLEPNALPTVGHPGRDVTHTFELTIAPWYSITVCDPQSAPENPCTPKSDANAPAGSYPGAGAAFVELQFYPPGFAPFTDNISCDDAHWCSALNIDSLECSGSGFAPSGCNQKCTEPFNFQPECATARAQNLIPWGFGPYMINSQFEIGHFEPCTSLQNPVTTTGDTFYTNC